MKEWTIEEEAAALKKRFEGVNRAAFVRETKFPGGQAMVYQHINALRPMSLEAALIYAKFFGCPLSELSPRLDRLLQLAADQAQGARAASGGHNERNSAIAVEPWPFEDIDEGKVRALSDRQLAKLEAAILLAADKLGIDVAKVGRKTANG